MNANAVVNDDYVTPLGGAQNSKRIRCSGDMVGHDAKPYNDQKSGQFLVRTEESKFLQKLAEFGNQRIATTSLFDAPLRGNGPVFILQKRTYYGAHP